MKHTDELPLPKNVDWTKTDWIDFNTVLTEFARRFKKRHGIPDSCCKCEGKINLYGCPSCDFTIKKDQKGEKS